VAVPCLTLTRGYEVGGVNTSINILECLYLTTPTTIPSGTNSEIVAAVSIGTTVELGWSLSYSGSSTSLLTLSTGNVNIKYITIIHNSDSQGTILSITSTGSLQLQVYI
jgi:hypothetical protein